MIAHAQTAMPWHHTHLHRSQTPQQQIATVAMIRRHHTELVRHAHGNSTTQHQCVCTAYYHPCSWQHTSLLLWLAGLPAHHHVTMKLLLLLLLLLLQADERLSHRAAVQPGHRPNCSSSICVV
jgi:hypothetical protein